MSDSSTGGYLQPTPVIPQMPGGLSLRQFLQTVFVGISGLPPELVRPRWQKNPPKQPDIDTNWMAFGIQDDAPDANAFLGMTGPTFASGWVRLKFNPTPGVVITLNGAAIEFVAASPMSGQVLIGETVYETTANLATYLKNSLNPLLLAAKYSSSYAEIGIVAVLDGVAGNAFTLATNSPGSVLLSASTLTGGALTSYQSQRHSDIEVMCSFYGPDAYDYAGVVRDGLQLPQNAEALRSVSMAFVSSGRATQVPDLVNERWVERFEMSVQLRREVIRTYPILTIVSVSGVLQAVVGEELKSVAWQQNT